MAFPQSLRTKLAEHTGQPADATDEALAEAAALELEAQTKDLGTAKSEITALSAERDTLKTEVAAKANQVLQLSADDPAQLSPANLASAEINADTLWETAITSGAISRADVVSIKGLLRDKSGKMTRLALSASGDNQHPLEFNLARALCKLSTPIRTGNAMPRGVTAATPGTADPLSLSGDRQQAADKDAEKAEGEAAGKAWQDSQRQSRGLA